MNTRLPVESVISTCVFPPLFLELNRFHQDKKGTND